MTCDDVILPEDKDVERIQQNSKAPYSETCLFKEVGEFLLFDKKKYNVALSVGLMANKMHTVNYVFEKGAGPSPLRKDIREAERTRAIQVNNRAALKNTINEKVRAVRTIMLYFSFGDSKVRLVSSGVCNLALPILLGTS